ncbi:hypothetical protein SAMN05216278_3758 [Halopelagius longus]|uniref:Uncharacterized protein n=1 Tax=Halopelagius longus TaxID=1236180 RepID=A0A1H1GLW6_9EURY|nr:hypothetical protein SAMN05216278_3758 [Halopelagius longus]
MPVCAGTRSPVCDERALQGYLRNNAGGEPAVRTASDFGRRSTKRRSTVVEMACARGGRRHAGLGQEPRTPVAPGAMNPMVARTYRMTSEINHAMSAIPPACIQPPG